MPSADLRRPLTQGLRSYWYNYRKAAARQAMMDAKVQQADAELASVTVFRPPPPPKQIRLLAPRPAAVESGGRKGGYMPTEGLDPAAAHADDGSAYDTESEYASSLASVRR